MYVQDGFLYLIVTRHKLTVWVGKGRTAEVSAVLVWTAAASLLIPHEVGATLYRVQGRIGSRHLSNSGATGSYEEKKNCIEIWWQMHPFDTDAKAAGAYRYMGCASRVPGIDFLIVQVTSKQALYFCP